MTIQTELHRTQRLERSAQRVMDSLDRQDERMNLHYSGERKNNRHELRAKAVVLVQRVVPAAEGTPATPDGQPATTVETEKLQVWVRNVSPTGLSFVYPQEIAPKKLIVGLIPTPGAITWFHAEVMRVRKAIEGFWEYGVAFRERATV